MAQIVRNSDFPVTITVTNADGTVFDLTTATEIVVVLYQRNTPNQIATFKLSDATVILTDGENGVMKINVEKNRTKSIDAAPLYAEIDIVLNNGQFEGGEMHTKISDIFIAEVIKNRI